MEMLPDDASNEVTAHVVIFPLPIQGPVNCMLKLAEFILSLSQTAVAVTFLNTEFIQHRLDLHSPAAARLARFGSRFGFATVPDGFGSFENPRGALQIADITNFLGVQAQTAGSRLRELLAYGLAGPGCKPVTCVIADGLFWFMADVANEIRVPLVYFDTISPCGLWTCLCVPKMLHAGDLPFPGDDMDAPVTSVPGMETYLRRRDLPTFCRDYDPNKPVAQLILKEAQHYSSAQGHILNTFDDLEGELLSHMHPLSPNLYTVGPLHLNLTTRLEQEQPESVDRPLSFSNSIWQEDRSCLTWLDAQPSKSVLFVSIGSLAFMTKDQLFEFWHGLLNSGTRFLWVRRPNSVIDVVDEAQLKISDEVLEGTKERGWIVKWAPQEEVLKHRAIGGFLTHSGWNSTLESIVEGVPMICWPFTFDQQVNSRLVSEVWNIGLDMKDTCSRHMVETMIKDLMDTRKDEFLSKVDCLAKLATHAVSPVGSSYNQLNRLIDDIQFKRFSIPSDAP
ncbi:7-deoxyloganetic acid glucosyltransferase-like [Silene latifolia]|uniref:7-deoxyloganetic acid glucosyltransferase-like n=1 Tax=Silene latifolia TaxID=37657 RepID=UPI003D76F0E1